MKKELYLEADLDILNGWHNTLKFEVALFYYSLPHLFHKIENNTKFLLADTQKYFCTPFHSDRNKKIISIANSHLLNNGICLIAQLVLNYCH